MCFLVIHLMITPLFEGAGCYVINNHHFPKLIFILFFLLQNLGFSTVLSAFLEGMWMILPLELVWNVPGQCKHSPVLEISCHWQGLGEQPQ